MRSLQINSRINNSVTYGGGQWVTVGDNGRILTSSDGITWAVRTSGTVDALASLNYGAGLWIAGGYGGGFLTSPDAITWTARPSGTITILHGLAYGGGQWAAVGAPFFGSNSNLLVSPNGISWTVRPSATTENLYSIAYNGSQWVAVGAFSTIVYSSAPLPVSFVFFRGESLSTTAHLMWETAWEKDAAYFLVERSGDAKSFEPIGRLNAQGTTNQHQQYAFLDENLPSGLWYYRLKQVDQTGTYGYSSTIALRIGTEPLTLLTLSPNPSPGFLTIENKEGLSSVRILSATGVLIEQQIFEPAIERWTWESPRQPAGSYLIQVNTGNGSIHALHWVKQ